MKQKIPRSTGIISVVVSVLIVLTIYTLLGTVNLVFMKDGRQVSRQEGVNMFSDIELPEGELTYTVNGETKPLEYIGDLKAEIGVTVLTNFLSFKWQERDNVITITQE